MKKIEFEYYNEGEFFEFLNSLPSLDASKLATTIQFIEEIGLEAAQKQKKVKKLGKNLYEVRSHRSSNYQRAIYFVVEGNHCVITNGFTKKGKKTPKHELDKAKKRRKSYFEEHHDDNKGDGKNE